MKRTLLASLALLLSLSLVGCGEETTSSAVIDSANQVATVDEILEAGTAEDSAPVTESVEVPEEDIPAGFGSYEGVDIDLTTMGSVMVYTQVYNLMANSPEYVGQTVKVSGSFGYYYESSVDAYYYGVVVQDATACCAQGIEFVLAGGEDMVFPDDYPEAGETVTVVGVFNSYFPEETPDWEFYHLEQAEIITE